MGRIFSKKTNLKELILTASMDEKWNDPESAVNYYEKALKIYPDYLYLRLALARCNLKLLKFDLVKTNAEKYLEAVMFFPEANFYMGIANYYQGNLEKAMENFHDANKFFPATNQKKSLCLEYIGDCLDKTGEDEKAIVFYEDAIKGGNSNALIKLFSLGEIFFQKKNFELALIVFSKIIKLDYKNYKAWDNLGTIFLIINDRVNADICFQQSLNVHPEGEYARMNIKSSLNS